MFKFFGAALCFAVMSLHCAGQYEAPVKKYNHYLGLQVNELLRQLVNFSNTNTTINNPYLLVYSISDARTNWGAHVGFGYDYKRISDKDAPVSKETKVNDLFLRAGVERKYSLGKKFEAGTAFDLTMGYQLDKTFSLSVTNTGSSIDSSATTVTTKTNTYGLGPQLSLGFHITEKLILGTEASFYFTTQKLKQNIMSVNTTTSIFTNDKTVSTSNSNLETDTDEFSISLPIAIFLIVKF